MSLKKNMLSAMAGLAMLAIPVSALAHPKDFRDDPRPFAEHDQGWHRGWFKHQPDGPRAFVPPVAYQRAWVAPVNNYRPLRPIGWRNGYRNYLGCDADGDDCRWMRSPAPVYSGPRLRCDADGDDCEQSYNPGYWNNGGGYYNNGGGYDYDEDESPGYYQMMPPAGYGLEQQRAWLVARRHRAMVAIARLRARGDSRGAQRLVPIVDALNRRIAGLNYRLGYNGGYGYAPANYAYAPAGYGYAPTGYGYAPGNSLAGLASSPLLYGNGAYTGNPTVDALSSLVVPMLTGVR